MNRLLRIRIGLGITLPMCLVLWSFDAQPVFAKTTSKTSNAKSKSKSRTKNTRSSQSKSTSSNEATSKTIGDLLKKIDKKSEAVKFNKRQSALPQFQKQSTQPKAKVNLRNVKPPSSNQLYFDEGTDEAKLLQVTDEGINQLYKLTRQYSKSSKRGELWLRLAEMYVEKSRLIEYQLLNKHDLAMQDFLNGKTKRKPKLNLSAATEYNKKAIQLYEWFLRDFPSDSKVDQALFFLGFNYFELGDNKKGQSFYVRLTKEHPRSLYVSESNFALGEYHFEAERWRDAAPFYIQVAKQKSGRLYTFALYKLAWCYYKQNDSKKGLRYLEEVILEGRRSKGQKDKSIGGVSRIRLATESIKDLIIFFSEAGDYTKARNYFEQIVGERSVNSNLERLAYFYSDTGNRTAAQFVFKDLIDQNPNSIKAYDYQYAIVKMYGTMGGSKGFQEQLYGWIEDYGPGSSWQKINSKDKESIVKANELMENQLRNHVLQQHQVAQNSRTKTSQSLATQGYEIYFKTFEQTPKLDEMHFFFGELLFDMGAYEKAAFHYNWIADNSPNSQYQDKALLNALLAYEKLLPSQSKIKTIVGESTAEIAFPDSIIQFEKAAQNFLIKNPNSENATAAKYRLGSLYYLFNQFDRAIPILKDLVKNHPKTQYAKFSANHLLDIYNLRKDYKGLMQMATDILAIPEIAKSNVGAQIQDIKVKTDFKLAKDLEDKKDYDGSAKAYEDFAGRNKGTDLASAAIFNSAVNYERAGNILKAIALYTSVAQNKSKSTAVSAARAQKFLPVLYEKTGQYELAAKLFEQYAKVNPKDSVAVDYHYNAGLIFDGFNEYNSAVRNYELYIKKSRAREKVEALFLIAKIYERRGQLSKAISQYDQYLKSGPTNGLGVIEASYSIAKLHERLGRRKVTDEWWNKTIAIQRRLSGKGQNLGASFAAEAKFKLVSPLYNDLVAIRIPANPARQGAAVQAKLAMTNKLKDQLKTVVAYDDAIQIVAALSLQGQALQHMYEALLATPLPKGLKPEELKQYQEGVQKIADPFKAQAIETYSTAVERGHVLYGYSDYLNVAMANLAKLKNESEGAAGYTSFLTELKDWVGL